MPDGIPAEAITYSVADCRHGRILMAATRRGLCSVALGASERAMVSQLRRQFPDAELLRDDDAMAETRSTLVALADGANDRTSQRAASLQLDLSPTDFQSRVWEELRLIPLGETRTYSDVARAIGAPRSARAVARACASNPVALAIPCHRVVRSDGDLSGYRWGASRKEALLAQEGAEPIRA